MKAVIILLINQLLLLIPILAVDDPIKYWSDFELTWSDFREINKSGQTGSELVYNLVYREITFKQNDTVINRYLAYCYMDKQLSWVDQNSENDQQLKFNQVIFDIVELYRRKLQHDLDRVELSNMAEECYRTKYLLCQLQIDRFCDETENGKNLEQLQLWEQKIHDELKSLEKNRLPMFLKRDFGHCSTIGVGTAIPTNKLGYYFSPSPAFDIGFDLFLKKSHLMVNAISAKSKSKHAHLQLEGMPDKQSCYFGYFNIAYGHTVFENQSSRLTPFWGLMASTLQIPIPDDLTGKTYHFDDQNLCFGIIYDYKLKKMVDLTPGIMHGTKQYNEINVRTKIYVGKMNFFEDFKGFSVIFTANLNLLGNLIMIQ